MLESGGVKPASPPARLGKHYSRRVSTTPAGDPLEWRKCPLHPLLPDFGHHCASGVGRCNAQIAADLGYQVRGCIGARVQAPVWRTTGLCSPRWLRLGAQARAGRTVQPFGCSSMDSPLPRGSVSKIALRAWPSSLRSRRMCSLAKIDEIMGRVYADIPAEDLAAAGRVLTLVRERANTELAFLQHGPM
jgi:hypothetical protein